MTTTKIRISGMHCHSCKTLIEDVCKEIKGVLSCDVNLATGVATITHDGSVATANLATEIRKLGDYKTEVMV